MSEQNKSVQIAKLKRETGESLKVTVKLDAEQGKAISKIHSVKPLVKITGKDTIDNNSSVVGLVEVSAVYETSDGDFCFAKSEAEFSKDFQTAGVMNFFACGKASEVDVVSFDENNITVTVLVDFVTSYIISEEVAKEFEETAGLVFEKENFEMSRVLGSNATNFNLSIEAKNKVSSSASIIAREGVVEVTSMTAGIDNVKIEGRVHLNFIVDDEGKLENVTHEESFEQEIECYGANPGAIIDGRLQVVSILAGVVGSENTGDINVSLELEGSVVCFVDQEITAIKDAYSVLNETMVNFECVNIDKISKVEYEKQNIDLSADITSRMGVDELIGVINPKLYVSSTKFEDETTTLEGVVEATFIYNNNAEETTLSFTEALPFVVRLENNNEFSEINPYAVSVDSFKLKAGNSITIDASLMIQLSDRKKSEIVYVSYIEESAEEAIERAAIRVYIPSEKETLYSVAKRLRITPETLLAQNPDLESGVVAGEKIYVYSPLSVTF